MPDRSVYEGIPWAIAVIGWACTHLFSEARERRKEVRAQLDKAYEQLQKLEQDSRAFHCATNFDAAKSGDLTTRIFSLERALQRIKIIDMDRLIPHRIGLRRAVTLQNFELSSFQPQLQESPLLLEISAAADDLEQALESQYSARYPATFPYFVIRK